MLAVLTSSFCSGHICAISFHPAIRNGVPLPGLNPQSQSRGTSRVRSQRSRTVVTASGLATVCSFRRSCTGVYPYEFDFHARLRPGVPKQQHNLFHIRPLFTGLQTTLAFAGVVQSPAATEIRPPDRPPSFNRVSLVIIDVSLT